MAGVADQQQFQIIVDKIYKYLNETPDRVPFSDWSVGLTSVREGKKERGGSRLVVLVVLNSMWFLHLKSLQSMNFLPGICVVTFPPWWAQS